MWEVSLDRTEVKQDHELLPEDLEQLVKDYKAPRAKAVLCDSETSLDHAMIGRPASTWSLGRSSPRRQQTAGLQHNQCSKLTCQGR